MSADDSPRHRLLCAVWTSFHPDGDLGALPHTAKGAETLGSTLAELDALADDPVVISDRDGVACINAIEDFLSVPGESAIIYLASHGLYPSRKAGYLRLATGDTRELDDLTRSLPITEVIERLQRSSAGQKLLIVDACYSGAASEELMAGGRVAELPAIPGICYLASSGSREASVAPRGNALTLFTDHLVEVLKRGVAGAGPLLTINQVYEALVARTAQSGGPKPRITSQGQSADSLFVRNAAQARAPAAIPVTAPSDHRAEILYVDDEEQPRHVFKAEVEKAGHTVTLAATPDEARRALANSYFDIIVLDLFLVDDVPATELIAHMATAATESMVLLVSRHSKASETSWGSLARVFQYANPIDAFLFKDFYIDAVLDFADRIRRRRAAVLSHIFELEQVIPLVTGRIIKRAPAMADQSDALELQARICVQRLVARWFDEGSSALEYVKSMTVQSFGSGRSSCTVLSLTPTISGISAAAVSPLLLKLGPRHEIEEEVKRFDTYVQIGVPLELRTDKVGSAAVGAVGGVIYSLLGGDPEAVSELGQRPPDEIEQCLRTVFDRHGKKWYGSLATGGVRLLPYFQNNGFGPDRFLQAARDLRTGLGKAGREWADAIDESFYEHPSMSIQHPATLVHGDMHLGNMIVYGQDRYRYGLIDYRNVGIGPRLTDFVTLEIACWLLALAPDRPRGELLNDVVTAAQAGVPRGHDDESVAPWLRPARQLAGLCRTLSIENFEDSTELEYAALLWLSAVRRSAFRSTATSTEEKRTMRVVPAGLAIVAERLIRDSGRTVMS